MYKLLYVDKSTSWVWCRMESLLDGTTFHVVNVYISQDLNKKKELWSKLMQIVANHQEDRICFIGDYNCIRDDSERENCVYRRNDTVGFNQFVDSTNLLDLAICD